MDIKVEINQDVHIDAERLAMAVAKSDSLEQSEFFYRFSENVNHYNWCMQAYMIANEFEIDETYLVIDTLQTLIEHLKERQNG